MPNESIELSRILPARPRRIFDAWLDAAEHTAMTGGAATIESADVGGRFTAWDGYIDGSHLALEPGRRILQSWRSEDFPPDAVDSLLEVRLAAARGGTRVTIRHSDIPAGQGVSYLQGWDEHYLDPMERYFRKATRSGKALPTKRKPSGARKAVARKATIARQKVPKKTASRGRRRARTSR